MPLPSPRSPRSLSAPTHSLVSNPGHRDRESSPDVIRSSSNRLVRFVRSLQRRSVRHAERAFVVEGERAVFDALATNAEPIAIALREGDSYPNLPVATSPRVVAPEIFLDLCDTVRPQGILAVFPFPDIPVPVLSDPLFVVADRISDPGNLGTLLRSAAAAGATAVFLSPDTVDAFNPKVVRAAMGAHFRIPIADLTHDAVDLVHDRTTVRALADLGPYAPPESLDWRQPAALIVASETSGPSETARRLATDFVTIPMAHGVESLNAAVAGSVILFEAARQRRL